MATIVDRYVNPDSAGGDGTTPSLTGSSAAYTSIAAAFTAEFTNSTTGNLVTRDVQYVFHCDSAGTADGASAPSFSNLTMDATRYVVVQVDTANRHHGIWDNTKYRIETTQNNFFNNAKSYLQVRGLQHVFFGDDNGIGFVSAAYGQGGFTVEGCLSIIAPKIGGYSYGDGSAFFAGGTDSTLPSYVYNNIASGWDRFGTGKTTAFVKQAAPSGRVYAYNNTILCDQGAAGCTFYAFVDGYGGIIAKNNLVVAPGNIGAFKSGSISSSCDYNSTTFSAATGGAHDLVSQTIDVWEIETDDSRLAAADTSAKGKGIDLSSDSNLPITVDIAGAARTSPPDIGALNVTAAVFPSLNIPAGLVAASSAYNRDDFSGYASSSAMNGSSKYDSMRVNYAPYSQLDTTDSFESHNVGHFETVAGGYNYPDWRANANMPTGTRVTYRVAFNLSALGTFALATNETFIFLKWFATTGNNSNPFFTFYIKNVGGVLKYYMQRSYANASSGNATYGQDAPVYLGDVGSEYSDGTWREFLIDYDHRFKQELRWWRNTVRIYFGTPGSVTRILNSTQTSTNGTAAGGSGPFGEICWMNIGDVVTTANKVLLGRWEYFNPTAEGNVFGLRATDLFPAGPSGVSASGAISDGATDAGTATETQSASGAVSGGATMSGSSAALVPASGGISTGATASGTATETQSASGSVSAFGKVAGAGLTNAYGGIRSFGKVAGTGVSRGYASGNINPFAKVAGTGTNTEAASGAIADGATEAGTVTQSQTASGGVSSGATVAGLVPLPGTIGGISAGATEVGTVTQSEDATGGITPAATATGTVVQSINASGGISTGVSVSGSTHPTISGSGAIADGATIAGVGIAFDMATGGITPAAKVGGAGVTVDVASGAIADGATEAGTVTQSQTASGGVSSGVTIAGVAFSGSGAAGGIRDGATVGGAGTGSEDAAGGIMPGAGTQGTGNSSETGQGAINAGASGIGSVAQSIDASGAVSDGISLSGTVGLIGNNDYITTLSFLPEYETTGLLLTTSYEPTLILEPA